MREIRKQCKTHGLTLTKCGKSKYKILTSIGEVSYSWTCESISECKEAITQAVSLRSWLTASVV